MPSRAARGLLATALLVVGLLLTEGPAAAGPRRDDPRPPAALVASAGLTPGAPLTARNRPADRLIPVLVGGIPTAWCRMDANEYRPQDELSLGRRAVCGHPGRTLPRHSRRARARLRRAPQCREDRRP